MKFFFICCFFIDFFRSFPTVELRKLSFSHVFLSGGSLPGFLLETFC